ncbi:MAG TPA: sugar ABC transporter permease [Chloroflexota bacterium]
MSVSLSLSGTTKLPTRRRRRVDLLPYLLALPLALYLGAVLLFPIARGVLNSFLGIDFLAPEQGKFVGLRNYDRMVHDPAFWHAIAITLVYTVLVVCSVLIIATGMALLVNRPFKGRLLARGLITLPWAFPEVAAVLLWLWMFNQQYGILGLVARTLHLTSGNTPWLIDPNWAMLSLIMMTVWKIFPFYTLIILTALQTVQQELYEAAKIDGANPVQSFFAITLPGIMPVFGILTLLVTIWSLQRFTSIWLLTGGGPANATETIAINVYNQAFRFHDLGYGSTLGVVGLLLSLSVAALYFVSERRFGTGEV